ncbi:hypothetical protein VTK56DRAFT_3428 [Thermocarpiscus australiensis]
MPVKVITTELGHSIPPEAPHNITFHIPGWETAKALRRGDQDLLSKLVSIYPRFRPWCEVRQLSILLHAHLSLPPTHGTLLFLNPDSFAIAKHFSASPFRKPQHRVPPEDLLFRVVDIDIDTDPLRLSSSSCHHSSSDTTTTTTTTTTTEEEPAVVRLFVVAYPLAHAPGALGVWQNHGIGISTRLAAALLPAAAEAGRVRVLDFRACARDVTVGKLPAGTFLPEGEAHRGLRARIAELVGGLEHGVVGERDVFLYQTGMAAVYRLHRALMEARRGGAVVVLGSVFHNTWHLFSENEDGFKHFGRCDARSGVMEALEAYLAAEREAGRKVAYVFAEFPSNPILVSVDLRRLREVADKYDVPVVIDDTIGSFCNIDILPLVDVLVTSLTKSLSGYANVMGGAITLSPSARHYHPLKSTLTTHFHNEYFHPDAAQLLSNARDYHARSAILNRNALALATFLHTHSVSSPSSSPITAILYPPFTDTHANYLSVMRRPATQEEFTPGYGCLLAIEFTSLATARAFYDNLSVHQGPHLGAHHTLAFPFNDAIWGSTAAAAVADDDDDDDGRDMAAYQAALGARPEQVRVSVGLESEEELIDTFRAALEFAEEEEKKRRKGVDDQ